MASFAPSAFYSISVSAAPVSEGMRKGIVSLAGVSNGGRLGKLSNFLPGLRFSMGRNDAMRLARFSSAPRFSS